jgi:hypothetical protein
MANKNISVCPTCGHQSTEYTHSINRTLVSGLQRLHTVGGTSRLDALGLDYTQFTNFQKLRYFNLIFQTNKNNEWQITNDGIWFLQGRVQVPKYIITRNAIVIRKSSELVFIEQIKDCVEYKTEWQDQARHPTLFD